MHLRFEFRDEVFIHLRDMDVGARFVEEDAHAFCFCQFATAVSPREMEGFLGYHVVRRSGGGEVVGGIDY